MFFKTLVRLRKSVLSRRRKSSCNLLQLKKAINRNLRRKTFVKFKEKPGNVANPTHPPKDFLSAPIYQALASYIPFGEVWRCSIQPHSLVQLIQIFLWPPRFLCPSNTFSWLYSGFHCILALFNTKWMVEILKNEVCQINFIPYFVLNWCCKCWLKWHPFYFGLYSDH